MAPARDSGPRSPAALHPEGPGAVFVNGEPRPLPEPPSVAGALAALGLAARPVAVEVNGALIRRAEHAEARLAPGDRVEIVSFVGGG